MSTKLLDKWLNGEISPPELEELKQDPAFAAYQKIDRFVKQIEMPRVEDGSGLADLKSRRNKRRTPKVVPLRTFYRIAIAASVLVLLGFVYLNTLPQSYTTELAKTETIVLPDNSEVILNENSSLSFKDNKWDENRTLKLNGEAYFKVTRGRTFDVVTSQGTITVIGTRFNVIDREDRFEVVCFEGSVGVSLGQEYAQLSAGDQVSWEGATFTSEKKYTSRPNWIHNESSFEDAPVTAVLDELKSAYTINVITENIDVDLRYTGSFTNSDLQAALETICLSLGLTYAIENNTVILVPKE